MLHVRVPYLIYRYVQIYVHIIKEIARKFSWDFSFRFRIYDVYDCNAKPIYDLKCI